MNKITYWKKYINVAVAAALKTIYMIWKHKIVTIVAERSKSHFFFSTLAECSGLLGRWGHRGRSGRKEHWDQEVHLDRIHNLVSVTERICFRIYNKIKFFSG